MIPRTQEAEALSRLLRQNKDRRTPRSLDAEGYRDGRPIMSPAKRPRPITQQTVCIHAEFI